MCIPSFNKEHWQPQNREWSWYCSLQLKEKTSSRESRKRSRSSHRSEDPLHESVFSTNKIHWLFSLIYCIIFIQDVFNNDNYYCCSCFKWCFVFCYFIWSQSFYLSFLELSFILPAMNNTLRKLCMPSCIHSNSSSFSTFC